MTAASGRARPALLIMVVLLAAVLAIAFRAVPAGRLRARGAAGALAVLLAWLLVAVTGPPLLDRAGGAWAAAGVAIAAAAAAGSVLRLTGYLRADDRSAVQ